MFRNIIEIKSTYKQKKEIVKKIDVEKAILNSYRQQLKAINKKLDNWLNNLLKKSF